MVCGEEIGRKPSENTGDRKAMNLSVFFCVGARSYTTHSVSLCPYIELGSKMTGSPVD